MTRPTYTYDAENRLLSVTKDGNVTEFVYDGMGHRVMEKLNGVLVKQFVWIGTELAEERDASGNVTKRYFAQGYTDEVANATYYYNKDHLGSVREVTDSTGTVRAQYTYDPYGKRTKLMGTIDADMGFTGHYTRDDLGLVLTYYRAYDSETGTWLTRDPIGENGGVNLYAYVEGNPVNGVDPLGLDQEDAKKMREKYGPVWAWPTSAVKENKDQYVPDALPECVGYGEAYFDFLINLISEGGGKSARSLACLGAKKQDLKQFWGLVKKSGIKNLNKFSDYYHKWKKTNRVPNNSNDPNNVREAIDDFKQGGGY